MAGPDESSLGGYDCSQEGRVAGSSLSFVLEGPLIVLCREVGVGFWDSLLNWGKVKRPKDGLPLGREGIGSQKQGCWPSVLPVAGLQGDLVNCP